MNFKSDLDGNIYHGYELTPSSYMEEETKSMTIRWNKNQVFREEYFILMAQNWIIIQFYSSKLIIVKTSEATKCPEPVRDNVY